MALLSRLQVLVAFNIRGFLVDEDQDNGDNHDDNTEGAYDFRNDGDADDHTTGNPLLDAAETEPLYDAATAMNPSTGETQILKTFELVVYNALVLPSHFKWQVLTGGLTTANEIWLFY